MTAAATDFDESTPPPRARPQGPPAPTYADLPPGEDAVATYLAWDEAGRVPAGSVLCRYAGTDLGRVSGYAVAAYPGGDGVGHLGRVGADVPAGALADWHVCSTLVERRGGRAVYAVLAPGAA